MTPTETLLSRASTLLKTPLIWVMPEATAGLRDISSLAAVHSFRPDVLALKRMGVAVGADWPALTPAAIAVTLPRQVEWAYGLLAQALDRLPAGGTLLITARNDRGGKRYAGVLEEHFGLSWSDSKNHCRMAAVERPQELPPIVAEWRQNYAPRQVEGTDLFARPGTFSYEHVDKASALLARHLPVLTGTVADFGAGWGYLSHCLLTGAKPPMHIDLFEADENALAGARANLKDFASKTHFFWQDLLTEPCTRLYDAIVMNPPFHDLQDANTGIGTGFIARAKAALKFGGQLWLVANKHLPYEDELKSFASCRTVTEDGLFKVMAAIR